TTTRLEGVIARDEELCGFPVTRVEILDGEGERVLGKPRGVYLTLNVSALWAREEGAFFRAAQALAYMLEPLLPEEGPVLAAGLGNPAMTPDALGPQALTHVLVTRHLREVLPTLRSVSALGGGVLASTGIEAAEWIRGAAEHVKPAAVVVIDALAARSLDRLCSTIQVSDTGLIPGSGVGNHRQALTRETLGVPVISIGVPTVVSVETAAKDLLAQAGGDEEKLGRLEGKGLFVTPDSIDAKVRELARVVGYGLDLVLQPTLEPDDLEALLA
ncbi:MAG: GPR endopeptidase, partial [Oscillospiraceae bacterium]|nr:GPR endopeptidase [Oscillospiraceae bacterium]